MTIREPINQSINQSNGFQWTNQSINQSIERMTTGAPINQSINQWGERSPNGQKWLFIGKMFLEIDSDE